MNGNKDQRTNRSHGGPGSSHQDASEPQPPRQRHPTPDEPTNPSHSRVSGGGGERDSHHTRNPRTK